MYRAKQDKQARAAKRKAIIQTNALAHQQDKIRLQQLLSQYELELAALDFQEEILAIDEQLFAIEEAKYQQNQISPSAFLKIKRGYLVRVFEVGERRRAFEIREMELFVVAKFLELWLPSILCPCKKEDIKQKNRIGNRSFRCKSLYLKSIIT